MRQTIRQMRELQSMDNSNHTLRFNRTMQEAGMQGGIDTEAPTGAAIVWGLVCTVVALAIWGWVAS